MSDILERPSTTYETTHHSVGFSDFSILGKAYPNGSYTQASPTTVYFEVCEKVGSDTVSTTWFLRTSLVPIWEEDNEWSGRKEWDENNKEEEQ
jgi:hypothetical protein